MAGITEYLKRYTENPNKNETEYREIPVPDPVPAYEHNLKPFNEWDDDYSEANRLGYSEHDTMGYDYLGTRDTVNPIVQEVRNTGLYGGVPYISTPTETLGSKAGQLLESVGIKGIISPKPREGWNCTTLFGSALSNTPFAGVRNTADLANVAIEQGLFEPVTDGNWHMNAGDIAVYPEYSRGGRVIEPYGHAVMMTENGGIIQTGASGAGAYETDDRKTLDFGGNPAFIVRTSKLQNDGDTLRFSVADRDKFLSSIYGDENGKQNYYEISAENARYEGSPFITSRLDKYLEKQIEKKNNH